MVEKASERNEEQEGTAMSWLKLLAEANRTLRATMGGALPDEFWQHVRSSRKEGLLAARCLIDAQIERMERQDDKGERKATKISIK